jgi:hypothetical protein
MHRSYNQLKRAKSILKLQHRSVEIDLSEVLITDFIQLPTSVGATGPNLGYQEQVELQDSKEFRDRRELWSTGHSRRSRK